MAAHQLPLVSISFGKPIHQERISSSLPTKNFINKVLRPIKCRALTNVSTSSDHIQTIPRRSADYKPSIWNDDYIQSLSSEYTEELYGKQSRVLKEECRVILCKLVNHVEQLEMIDAMQRLGVAYHFNNEIRKILQNIHNNMDTLKGKKNLYATALAFRLLRQHGFNVSTDVFDSFQDEMGDFKKCQSVDIEGLLSLYEASFHSVENELILDEARDFTLKFLTEFVNMDKGSDMSLLITHALEFPLQWRVPRCEALWFINFLNERRQNMSHALLQFANLDFNMVQSIHQDELKYTSRWDLNAMDRLPRYMQICFLSLNNFVNEIAYFSLKEIGYNIIPYLKKAWADICKAFFIEAKWYHSRYTPRLQEYMENSWISISAPVILMHAYFFIPTPLKKEDLAYIEEYPNIIRYSAIILRLADDLGTCEREMTAGDVSKSIECYMNETGASEAEAREHLKCMLRETWKKMNEETLNSPFPESFIDIAINLGRVSLFFYQYGDGYSIQDDETNSRMQSLVMQPLSVISK